MVEALGLILAFRLAFELPAYHLMFVKDNQLFVMSEDMTRDECLTRAKTFKPRARAKCVLDPGIREIT